MITYDEVINLFDTVRDRKIEEGYEDIVRCQQFINVARSVAFARDLKSKSFESYANDVNDLFKKKKYENMKKNKYISYRRKKYEFDVIGDSKMDSGRTETGEPYCRTNPIEGKNYMVHIDADDYVFAWLVFNAKNPQSKLMKKDGFREWFINGCDEKETENKRESIYVPSPQWHLYEYILFQEINAEYRFSSCLKLCKYTSSLPSALKRNKGLSMLLKEIE